jgi:hypothetical protein
VPALSAGLDFPPVRVLLLVAALGLPAAAAAQATSSPSGLGGIVTRGPVSPVCVAEQPCTEPARNVVLLFWRGDHVVGRAVTDTAGRYRISLVPARYRVSRTVRGAIGGLEPDHARVLAGRFTRIDFSIDTGIR